MDTCDLHINGIIWFVDLPASKTDLEGGLLFLCQFLKYEPAPTFSFLSPVSFLQLVSPTMVVHVESSKN